LPPRPVAGPASLVGERHDKHGFGLHAVDESERERAREDFLPVGPTRNRPALRRARDVVDFAPDRTLEAGDQTRILLLRAIPISGPLQVGDRLRMPSDRSWHGRPVLTEYALPDFIPRHGLSLAALDLAPAPLGLVVPRLEHARVQRQLADQRAREL